MRLADILEKAITMASVDAETSAGKSGPLPKGAKKADYADPYLTNSEEDYLTKLINLEINEVDPRDAKSGVSNDDLLEQLKNDIDSDDEAE